MVQSYYHPGNQNNREIHIKVTTILHADWTYSTRPLGHFKKQGSTSLKSETSILSLESSHERYNLLYVLNTIFLCKEISLLYK